MQNVFTEYPEIPWKSGWQLVSGPEKQSALTTGESPGELLASSARWTLQLTAPEIAGGTRLLFNGLSVSGRRRPERNRVEALLCAPGVLCGRFIGLPAPTLAGGTASNGETWIPDHSAPALLLLRNDRFALVWGEFAPERARLRAETALEEDFGALIAAETRDREPVSQLFSPNPRHHPPVALAAEHLAARLRARDGALHGLWSRAEGFSSETFALNELYPLVRAWSLLDPEIALELTQTAFELQQSSGGFPAWIEPGGLASPAAPWPLIAQSFELAWNLRRDPAILKRYLPSLRKYLQWALRHFDPHRDRIPAWQSDAEAFTAGSFERGKATPELTVLLIAEIEAVLRLCAEETSSNDAASSLREERDHLARTLETIFWNPETRTFSNAWKDGHYLKENSFGSFLPLFWKELPLPLQTALLDHFEENRTFPGPHSRSAWTQEESVGGADLPALHQFLAFAALQNAGGPALRFFVHRAREGFAAWFERESIATTRRTGSGAAYAPGPVTSALILTVQNELAREAARAPSITRKLLRLMHRLKINRTDLLIALVLVATILIIHLAYEVPRSRRSEEYVTEAALQYQQGLYAQAWELCQKSPDTPLARLIQANLLMLGEQPEPAIDLYRKVLLQHPESPSALLGLALALQMNGEFETAVRRYTDFLEIHAARHPQAAELATEFIPLAREEFARPPRWRRLYALPLMNDLGL